jgi:branched-chain amino acid transport system ATP-binding protein
MLRIENLIFSYGKIQALKGVSFSMKKGEIVAIIGANGAGKSTLMRCIMGLQKPENGRVYLNDKPLPSSTHLIIKAGVTLVPEGRWIFPNLTVEENLLASGYLIKDRTPGIQKAYEMFPRLRERSKQRAGTMSGGEQQMLAIARGLMSNPHVLLLDEPSLGLAPLIVNEVINIIKLINRQGISILLVEQNARKAMSIAHHVCCLEQGRIVKTGTGEELIADEEVIATYLGKRRGK